VQTKCIALGFCRTRGGNTIFAPRRALEDIIHNIFNLLIIEIGPLIWRHRHLRCLLNYNAFFRPPKPNKHFKLYHEAIHLHVLFLPFHNHGFSLLSISIRDTVNTRWWRIFSRVQHHIVGPLIIKVVSLCRCHIRRNFCSRKRLRPPKIKCIYLKIRPSSQRDNCNVPYVGGFVYLICLCKGEWLAAACCVCHSHVIVNIICRNLQ